MVHAAGFEPEEEAYKRLVTRNGEISWYPYALGDENAINKLYVTANPRCSSCLEPNMDVLSKYPVAEWFVVRSTQQVQLHRFDSLYEEGRIKFLPDFLHVDVQGFEFQVLQGIGKYIDDVTCIEIETHLKPIYRKQRLFIDLKEDLERKGFFLRSLEVQGYFEGEVLELNAYFVKWDRDLDDRSRSLVRIWERIFRLAPRPLLPADCV
jgi:FkbM family methyltransferase